MQAADEPQVWPMLTTTMFRDGIVKRYLAMFPTLSRNSRVHESLILEAQKGCQLAAALRGPQKGRVLRMTFGLPNVIAKAQVRKLGTHTDAAEGSTRIRPATRHTGKRSMLR